MAAEKKHRLPRRLAAFALIFCLLPLGCFRAAAEPAADMTLTGAYVGWDAGTMGEWTAEGSAMVSPAGLGIPCAVIRTIELRLKSAEATGVRLYWKTSRGEFSVNNSAAIPVKNDNTYHDYQIDLSRKKEWRGTVDRIKLAFEGAAVSVEYLKATGVYIVPFAWGVGGDLDRDLALLGEIKSAYRTRSKTAVVGYSVCLDYMMWFDAEGNFRPRLVDYYIQLAEAAGMPVFIWLRADPWGYTGNLLDDDNAVMWSAATQSDWAYRCDEPGYYYLSFAPTDLSGAKTRYWVAAEQYLGKCAAYINAQVQARPGVILGVTTTSELKYNAKDGKLDLDYSPNTIQAFRDYCRDKYGTTDAFNAAMGQSITTWELKSTDYDPSTIENPGGFDAPRVRGTSAFWREWVAFRELLIQQAVQRLSDIIAAEMDSKYIYTHQICYEQGDSILCSPIESGYATNANMGIDMFTKDFKRANFTRINHLLGDDYTKSWGVPEWLHDNAWAVTTFLAMRSAHASGMKYLCPFAWDCEVRQYDVKGSRASRGVQWYLRYLDCLARCGSVFDGYTLCK